MSGNEGVAQPAMAIQVGLGEHLDASKLPTFGSTARSKIFTSWVEILLRTNSLPRTPQQSGFSINTTTDTTENTCEKLWYSGFNLTTETC